MKWIDKLQEVTIVTCFEPAAYKGMQSALPHPPSLKMCTFLL